MSFCRSVRIESLELRQLFASGIATIDGTAEFQTIEGIGAAGISFQQPAEYKTSAYYDAIAGDLGASVVRVNVWPAFENTNDNNNPNVIDWTKFDDSAIASTMEYLKQLQLRGINRILATVWTPPGWMKTNNAVSYGGQIRSDMRAEFAEFVSAYIQRARDKWGVNITEVSLSNEPWFVEPYQAAIHTPQALVEEIKSVATRLSADGLTTKIIAPEDVISVDRTKNYINTILSDPQASAAVSGWGSHYLSTGDMQMLKNHVAPTNKPIWYTEVGNGNATMLGAMSLARGVDNAIVKGGASTYINWYFSNVPGISNFESLMDGPTPNKKFYALKHYSKFVRPGAKLLLSSYADDHLRTTAFKHSGTGALTIVLSNNYDESSEISVNLTGTTIPASFRQFRTSETENCVELGSVAGASSMTLTLPPRSIVTLYAGPDFPAMPNLTPPGTFNVTQPSESWKTDAARNAALTGDLGVILGLIGASANIDLAGPDGWTPLDYAVACPNENSPTIIAALLNAGASKSKVTSEGFTPLHIAALNPMVGWPTPDAQPTDRVKQLLQAGFNVNAKDNYGRTPLFYAAMQPKFNGDMSTTIPDTSLIQALLDAGANPNLVDNFGKRPFEYAQEEKFTAGANLLQSVMSTSTATISGRVFNDANGNNQFDISEAGISGRTVYIDLNDNQSLDGGEPTQLSNATGNYVFAGLNPGLYSIRQVVPSGWSATINSQILVVAGGDFVPGVNLGSKQNVDVPSTGSISGVLFNDNNKNGLFDSGDVGVARTVFIDANGNKTLDSGETSKTSNADGSYTFSNLPAGSYKIRRVFPTGYSMSSAPIDLNLAAGQVVTGANIGSVQGTIAAKGSILATAYNDANRNSTKDASESFLAGVTVYLDTNNNSVKDSSEVSVVTNASGQATFSNLVVGSYRVRALLSNYDVTQQPASTISVVANTTSNVQFGLAVKQVVTGSGTISGYVVNDTNKNGAWNSGELGISGRTVWIDLDNDNVLDANETKVTTASNGKYTFSNVAVGSYKVRTLIPTGWKQNKPASNAAFSITIAAGQTKSGNDFMTSLK